jgi:hypothetical protein
LVALLESWLLDFLEIVRADEAILAMVHGTLKDTPTNLFQWLSLLTYPTHLASRNTKYKSKIWDVLRNDGSSTHGGPSTNGDWGNAYRALAD